MTPPRCPDSESASGGGRARRSPGPRWSCSTGRASRRPRSRRSRKPPTSRRGRCPPTSRARRSSRCPTARRRSRRCARACTAGRAEETAADALRAWIGGWLERQAEQEDELRVRRRVVRAHEGLRAYEHRFMLRAQDALAEAFARDLGASPADLEPRMAAAATLAVFAVLGDEDDLAARAPGPLAGRDARAGRPRAGLHQRRDRRPARAVRPRPSSARSARCACQGRVGQAVAQRDAQVAPPLGSLPRRERAHARVEAEPRVERAEAERAPGPRQAGGRPPGPGQRPAERRRPSGPPARPPTPGGPARRRGPDRRGRPRRGRTRRPCSRRPRRAAPAGRRTRARSSRAAARRPAASSASPSAIDVLGQRAAGHDARASAGSPRRDRRGGRRAARARPRRAHGPGTAASAAAKARRAAAGSPRTSCSSPSSAWT